MNIARHHNEWLSLVETSGPFLSLPVLLRVFPQGLDARDPSQASRLREAYEDWLEQGTKVPAVHHAWIRHVLQNVLGYPADLLAEGQAIPPGLEAVMATFNETLRPDMVLKHREPDQKPVLLIGAYAASQDLQKPVGGRLWKASPGTRMMELLHTADVPAGLVTNGEEWMLVSAHRGETTGFASWHADLWMQEPLTLRAFHSLLHLRRLVGVAKPDTLPGLLLESSKDQQEVTDQLGYQVREAVEVLVQAFDRIDAESGRILLATIDEKTLYDGALTVMMRLVFLFSAEERGLLLLGDPLYDQNYAVSTLSELLRERADQHGEEVLERRHDAWCRLLATFRAVHAGVEHEAMRLPPYGGSLFDPDRYPFLEGRSVDGSWQSTVAKPLVINNRVVLHLLEALQMLRVKVPGGGPAEARRLSFSSLDIEQIGHVYEGLLDHTTKRADEPMLGLAGSKAKEPEVPLHTLEDLSRKGTAALVECLCEETGRSEKTLTRLIEIPPETDEHALLIACGQNETIAQRVKPFTSLLRRDSFGRLVVIHSGSIYLTAGSDRRSTGTHYTPRSLTEPIVKYTLEPLVYVGHAEGLPSAEWTLKSPKEILALKVCDMAMGSGAFLVEACRYLAERLAEAWENAEREHAGSFVVTPDGELSTGSHTERLTPTDSAERVAIARRYVADRCLYGVDINPMAVEMAKLSLWLITLQRDRPFSFLDHALKCGDSLLGVITLKQVENFSLRPGERQVTFATAHLPGLLEEASTKRRVLEGLSSNDYTQIETKNRLHAEAEAAIARVKALADCLIAFELHGLDGEAYEEQRADEAENVQLLIKRDTDASLKPSISNHESALAVAARKALSGRRPFHWQVEFPEVFARTGFDAFVGNPPFIGGTRITAVVGSDYREYLVRDVANRRRGSADLCAYFYLRVCRLLNVRHGTAGLVATNTICQGDTREVGLDQLEAMKATIVRAISSYAWPGDAALQVAHVWFRCGDWSGGFVLDDSSVAGITTRLTPHSDVGSQPEKLLANSGHSFNGAKPYGKGFVLTPEQATGLLRNNSKNRSVLYPYLIGDDLNSRCDQTPSRWVINFSDWPLDPAHDAHGRSKGPPYASDFPDCLEIVRASVKPVREKLLGRNSIGTKRGTFWWLFGSDAKRLHLTAAKMSRVLARALTSKHHGFVFCPTNLVFDQTVAVVTSDGWGIFALLQSNIHCKWALEFGNKLETRPQYTTSDCFETFPFPSTLLGIDQIGSRYYEARTDLMLLRQQGLTKTYNRFHDQGERSDDIGQLRELHVEMDQAVVAAYGWSELDLGHGFHETKQGVRYTVSESARRTVLDRLLALNHQRYAEEVNAGLHNRSARKATRGRVKRKDNAALELFG